MNKERRKFIRTACLCGGFLLFGRIAGSIFPGINTSKSNTNIPQKENSGDKESAFYDNKGNKVLVIEK